MLKNIVKLIYFFFDKIVSIFPDSEKNQNEYLQVYFQDLKINHEKIIEAYFKINEDCYGMSDVFTEQKQIAASESWKTFFFRIFGYDIKFNNLKCNFLNIPSLTSYRVSSILFSILKAGEEIKPHKGIYKGVIRVHLGLIIPKGECYININEIKHYWKKGELLIFDDTDIHSAVNKTKEDRVVLFLDVIRVLPFPLNIINQILFKILAISPYVKNILNKINDNKSISTTTTHKLKF